MIFLPIVQRELKVGALHVGARWIRVAVAGLAVLFCAQWFVFHAPWADSNVVGRAVYRTLAWAAFLAASAGFVVTADSISSERREGTLGLLFLTDLKGRDVVLAKFAAKGLNAIYALIGLAPMLMLPLVTGGVTAGEAARTALALVNALFVSLAVGLAMSVRVRNQFAAMRAGALALLVLFLLPWCADFPLRSIGLFDFSSLSPAYPFVFADEAHYAAGSMRFWLALFYGQCEAWLLLATAALSLSHTWRRFFSEKRAPSGHERRRKARRGGECLMRHEFRSFAPVAYAALRLPGQRGLVWVATVIWFLGSVFLAVAVAQFGALGAFGSLAAVIQCGGAALYAWLAGRFYFEARRSGELELLLSTPAGASGIIREQWLALVRLLRGPLLLVMLGAIPYTVVILSSADGHEFLRLSLGLLRMANAPLDVLAICWVGMWFGLRAGRPFAVMVTTVGLTHVAPVIAGCVAEGSVASLTLTGGLVPGFGEFLMPLLMIGKNLFFIWWAREKLRGEFRIGRVANIMLNGELAVSENAQQTTHTASRELARL